MTSPPQNDPIRAGDKENELLVFDHGFVRLDDSMATDLSVVNSARVSFAVRQEEIAERDKGLIKFLMRERHGTPFEHNSFRFHVRTPIFVAREWFRHRIGCLTGDTEVTFVNNNGAAAFTKTMEELWMAWHWGERDGQKLTDDQVGTIEEMALAGASIRAMRRATGRGYRAVERHLDEGSTELRDARSRMRKMRLRVLNEESGEFETGHICDVIDKGMQPIYRVTLVDGKEIEATENHRFLTKEGWATLREAVGLVGSGSHARTTRLCHLMVNGRPVYEETGYDYTCQVCGKRGGKLHAHHIVPVWADLTKARDIGNLISVCDSCHRPIHRTQKSEMEFAAAYSPYAGFVQVIESLPQRKGCKLTVHPIEVFAVTYVGVEQTYDLSVQGRWHNFIANGMVVHNSFNEESARYHKLSDDFYLPEPQAVRSQAGKPGAYFFEPASEELADETRGTFARIYKDLFAEYEAMLEKGVAKELARAILPFGIYTQFYWTLNARSLMNFLSLRNAETAQYEIRVYAQALERLFAKKMPVTHECFVEFGRRSP